MNTLQFVFCAIVFCDGAHKNNLGVYINLKSLCEENKNKGPQMTYRGMLGLTRALKLLALLIIIAATTSCGGGGGGSADSSSDPNTNPPVSPPTNLSAIANAGANRSVNVGDTVQLDGTQSQDPENAPLSYQWELVEIPTGSVATLSDTASPAPMLSIDIAGSYVISLTVNDGNSDSARDYVVITTLSVRTVSVSVPANIDPSTLKIITGNTSSIETLSNNNDADLVLGPQKQAIFLLDQFDNPVYLGFANSDQVGNVELNQFSTAQTLVVLFPEISAVIAENQTRSNEITDLIASLPAVNNLAGLIKDRIDAGTTSLVPMDDPLLAALASAVDAANTSINNLLNTATPRVASRIGFPEDGSVKSGIRVSATPVTKLSANNISERLIEVTIENNYKRFVTVGFYRNSSLIFPSSPVGLTLGPTPSNVKLDLDPGTFVDDSIEVRVYGPGLLKNAFDPGWADQRVYNPTIMTVTKEIAVPVIDAMFGANKICGVSPSVDDIFSQVVLDASVQNVFRERDTPDLDLLATSIIKAYLDKFVSNVITCVSGDIPLSVLVARGLSAEFLKLFRIYSANLEVARVTKNIFNSNKIDWWVISNDLATPGITFDPSSNGAIAPTDVTFQGRCDYPNAALSNTSSGMSWLFGNGDFLTVVDDGSVSTATTRYETAGDYTVSLSCYDEDGGTSEQSLLITIAAAQPTISVFSGREFVDNDSTPLNFGSQYVGEAGIERTITISNVGTGYSDVPAHNLNIVASSTDSQFVQTSLSSSSIPVNGSATLRYRFDPAWAGLQQASITIASNDSNTPVFTIPVEGSGIPLTAPFPSLYVSPSGGDSNTQFTADASGSFDAEDTNDLLVFRWATSMSGGAPTNWIVGTDTNTFTFTNEGTYTIWLEVEDTSGLTSGTTRQVVVNNDPDINVRVSRE